jgi:hypothetical protein
MVHPGFEILAAMAGRGVHEAGAGIIGDMIAVDERDIEGVAAARPLKRMLRSARQFVGGDGAQAASLDLGLHVTLLDQGIGDNELFAGLRTKIVFGAVTS